MEYDVSRRGFRSNAERRVMQHPEWPGLMKLLRQTAEDSAGVSTKHPKLVSLPARTAMLNAWYFGGGITEEYVLVHISRSR